MWLVYTIAASLAFHRFKFRSSPLARVAVRICRTTPAYFPAKSFSAAATAVS